MYKVGTKEFIIVLSLVPFTTDLIMLPASQRTYVFKVIIQFILFIYTYILYFKNSPSPPEPSYIRDFLSKGPSMLVDYGNSFFGILRDTIGR